ncbi:MAG: hypothetical protein KatS3mg076_1360 [Candidatus Binatia bacterium]|nr:MAG: hypothetical protein KatS3mg076_1360 [Candidatus Binatia bacterium]
MRSGPSRCRLALALAASMSLAPYAARATLYRHWSALYGGSGSEEMEGLALTSDGGAVVVGSTDSFADPNGDAWVVVVDAYGNVVWQKTYGGSGDESLNAIHPTPDGGYIAAGSTLSFGVSREDGWVVKLSPTGTVEWSKTYGGSGTEQFWSVDVTGDGNYVVSGGTTSFGAGREDFWVLKLDPQGDVLWQKTYGGPKDDGDCASFAEPECVVRVREDPDGNLVAVSNTRSFAPGFDAIWVLKLDPQGNVLWQKAFGGFDEDTIWSFDIAPDGNYLVPGSTVSFSPDFSGDTWVLKLDPQGNVLWQKVYAVPGDWDEALAVGATSDGGALVGAFREEGTSDWDWLLFRLDAAGNVIWQRRYEYGWDWPNSVAEGPDGSFWVAGVAWPSPAAELDLWVQKLDPQGFVGTSCTSIQGLALSVTDTNVTPVDTNATVLASFATVRSVDPTVADTGGGSAALCQANPAEDCSNGTDDDGDSLVDCSDPDCTGDADGDTYVAAPCGTDCDDNDPGVNPGAAEICTNGKDDECDGAADCADPDCAPTADGDGDTYPGGVCGSDCDDADPDVHPGATEACGNAKDDDCDGSPDCTDSECFELPVCTLSTPYARRRSVARFRLGTAQRDSSASRVCVTADFCGALSAVAGDPARQVTITLDGCPDLVVPGTELLRNSKGTRYRASSERGATPGYRLRVDCKRLRAVVRLRRADLQACVTNPVAVTLAASGTRSLRAEATFDPVLDGEGNLKKLVHRTDEACLP